MPRLVGVEEEFLLVDADGQLSGHGPEVVGSAREQAGALETELTLCQVESATDVCRTPDEILDQLTTLRGSLASSARERGLRLLPSGCPVLPEEDRPGITPKPRYQRMARLYGATARAGATCGCHVHVDLPDRALAVQVVNHARPWLPVLLTVTANSPFDGFDTGYASWRYQTWSRWPSAGPPPVFASLDEYESTVDALLRSGAILDKGMVYWDIRLSEHQPTLEFRVCDVAASASDAALLAILVRGLVEHAVDRISVGVPAQDVPYAVLRANLWRASRHGLRGECLHPVTGAPAPLHDQLADLVGLLRPALGPDAAFVEAGLASLRSVGTGADRQRAVFSRRRKLTDVVDELALR
ncbi:carboxylate-amine ligase [Actinophytocola sp.]|uniref:carboxylate-amine ligase n=1 Tax=Actinophytocola sp. TaxID=1872138 RepID=UPI003D6AF2E2